MSNISTKESYVYNYWSENDIFKKLVAKNKDSEKFFNFYDGPPFATGKPHYGHLVASLVKDVINRYKYSEGYDISNNFSWDCHGLPIEYIINEKYKIKTIKDIENIGINTYNNYCRDIVLQCKDDWRETISKFGRWVDFDNDYKTLDINFMETVWWIFGELSRKNLIYKGVKVMPFSVGCSTPLSNFEESSNYKEIMDDKLYFTLKLKNNINFETNSFYDNYYNKGQDNFYLCVMTTTPWTLPFNLCVCVNKDLIYNVVYDNKLNYNIIIEETCFKNVFKNRNFMVIGQISGNDLINSEYEPIFNYYDNFKEFNAFKVYHADFVSKDGTGLVHIAPGFGVDDYNVCMCNEIITSHRFPPCDIDDNGRYTDVVSEYKNLFYKDANKLVIKKLNDNNTLFMNKKEKHRYPFCWRSDTPLIYKACSSYFVNVNAIRDNLQKNINKTNWYPSHIRDKKFNEWISHSIDWSISRTRVWGNPIPVWTNGEETVIIDSIDKLSELSGIDRSEITDLHRDSIDHITIPSKYEGKPPLKRISDVFDCWFESGSMPYAQYHYPFENKELFENERFPADFISEGHDQVRGWFYTLMVISTALFDKPAFKNVIPTGLVLASDGQKMSKSKNNYSPPIDIINEYGTDPLRLYLLNCPIIKAESIKFENKLVKEMNKNICIQYKNVVSFFNQSVELYNKKSGQNFNLLYLKDLINHPGVNCFDIWILNYLDKIIKKTNKDLNDYKLTHIVSYIFDFSEKLSKTWLNLNKNRLKAFDENEEIESHASLNVLYYCLKYSAILFAPIIPYTTEYIYLNLKNIDNNQLYESVHLENRVHSILDNTDKEILQKMDYFIELINCVRKVRSLNNISHKKPITELTIIANNDINEQCLFFQNYIKDDLNILNVVCDTNIDDYHIYVANPNLKNIGKKYRNIIKIIVKYLNNLSNNEVKELIKDDKNVYITELDKYIDLTDMYTINKKTIEKENCFFINDTNISISAKFINNIENNSIYVGKLLNREIMNMRKKVGLIPCNEALVEYEIKSSSEVFDMVINNQDKYFKPHYKEYIYPLNQEFNKYNKYSEKQVVIDEYCELLIKLSY